MNFFPSTNFFNNAKSSIPRLPSIGKDTLKVFGKWCPSEENIKKMLALSFLGSTAIWMLTPRTVANNEYVFNASILWAVGGTLYSLAKSDPVYMNVAMTTSNLVGLSLKTINPAAIALAYPILKAIYPIINVTMTPQKEELCKTKKPAKITDQIKETTAETPKPPSAEEKTTIATPKSSSSLVCDEESISDEESSISDEEDAEEEYKAYKAKRENFLSSFLQKQGLSTNATQSTSTEAKSKELSIDKLPYLIDHLDQEFCIQKRARDELAEQIVQHYSNLKRDKNHIALYGPKDCGQVEIIKAIGEKLNITVIEILHDTTFDSFNDQVKDKNKQYIVIKHLNDKPFKMTQERWKYIYQPRNFLNIFISHDKTSHEDGLSDPKKQFMPGLPEELREQVDEVIRFDPFTKEDYRALLYQKNSSSPCSLYKLQEELKKKNRLLNVEEIPSPLIEQCLQRIVKSNDPLEIQVVLKELLTFILQRYSDKSKKTPIPVYLTELPKSFNQAMLTMTGMKAVLDEYIVGQDAAKQTIIEAIFFHQQSNGKDNPVKLPKGNILLIGPSGSGKTFIVETIARYLKIPMATMDLSRVTREGYIGPKISEIFVSLIDSANGDVEKASRGIVFFDEADKIFEDAVNGKNDITGLAIQNQLLCMLQGDTIRVGQNRYDEGGHTLKTENILFILAGAFHKQTMASQGKLLDDEQLIAGGMRPEFLGRIGYISQLSALTHDQIKQIVKHGPNSVLTAWKKQFEKFGFNLVMKEETLDQIVTNAMQKQTGARGLQYEVRTKLSKLLATLIMEQENSGISPTPGELKRIEV